MLKNLFKTHNVAQTLYLTNKLHSMRMEEGIWVSNFMHMVKETTTNLALAKTFIDEIKVVDVVMNALTQSYESFI